MVRTAADPTCTGRVVIVTGGSRGIGREVTRKLASLGYAVVVDYARNQGAADAAVAEVLAADGTALAVRADVADELDVARMFTEATEAFGGVDVVVHAARPVIPPSVADRALDAFDALQRTNVRGTFVVNEQAARQLRDGGAIVNLSTSTAGAAPLPTNAAHAASEGAVEAITPVLAGELRGRNITVNTVVPRPDRPGTPADIANVVAFLIGEEGHWVNGQVIRADGGVA